MVSGQKSGKERNRLVHSIPFRGLITTHQLQADFFPANFGTTIFHLNPLNINSHTGKKKGVNALEHELGTYHLQPIFDYTHISFIRTSKLRASRSTGHRLGCDYHGNSDVAH